MSLFHLANLMPQLWVSESINSVRLHKGGGGESKILHWYFKNSHAKSPIKNSRLNTYIYIGIYRHTSPITIVNLPIKDQVTQKATITNRMRDEPLALNRVQQKSGRSKSKDGFESLQREKIKTEPICPTENKIMGILKHQLETAKMRQALLCLFLKVDHSTQTEEGTME